MSSMSAAIDPAVARRASQWMARLWSDDVTDADHEACAAWRAEHPEHERAWSRLQGLDGKLQSVPREAARRALHDSGRAGNRRRMVQLLGLGLFSLAGLQWLRGTEQWQRTLARHSTGTGEVRELSLPDGTQVVMAPGTAFDIEFTHHQRHLLLRSGRILVTTAIDPAVRPFRVLSRQGSVRALGTRFTVDQGDGVSHVVVYECAVEIRPDKAQALPVRVPAGQGASFSVERVEAAGAARDSDIAWTRGVLVAVDMRLDAVLTELSAYRRGVLWCDPAVAGLVVTGVFSLQNTDRALENLASALPVSVLYRTRYWVSVVAA